MVPATLLVAIGFLTLGQAPPATRAATPRVPDAGSRTANSSDATDVTEVRLRLAAAALRLGATATPTFFINGREVQGATSLEAMSTIIDEEIVKANDLLAKGVKMDRLYAEMQKATAEKYNPPSAAKDIR